MAAAQERLTLAPVRDTPHFIRITITLGVAVVLRGIALILFGKDPLFLPGFTGDGIFFAVRRGAADPESVGLGARPPHCSRRRSGF